MKVSFLWLKEFLPIKESPQALADRLTMSGLEVESLTRAGKDTILELAMAPNRGDLWGHEGVAREIAAILKTPMKEKKYLPPKGTGKIRSRITLQVRDRERAPRYMVRLIVGVKVGPSPAWLIERLERLGLRSINNVVDVTNYVMQELGQPLHAFDSEKIREHALTIQTPASPMRLTTLDGVERTLTTEDLCIMDSGGPVAIAGITGGQKSGVTTTTASVLLESAYFLPTTIRRSSRRLALSTDSSRRFERSVDPDTVDRALHRATELIVELTGGTPTADWIDFYPRKIIPARVTLTTQMVNDTLGMEIKAITIVKYITSLGCRLRPRGAGKWQVIMPASRPDLTRPVDLIEEIIRLHGYDHIPLTVPSLPTVPPQQPAITTLVRRVRHLLASAGLYEAVHYGFVASNDIPWLTHTKAVAITNPLGTERTVLREELTPALIQTVAHNLCYRTMTGKLFEVRRVFEATTKTKIQETTHAAIALFGNRNDLNWTGNQDALDFYDIKGLVERLLQGSGLPLAQFKTGTVPSYVHPKESAQVMWQGHAVGWLGAIHPEIAQKLEITVPCYLAEINLDAMLPIVQQAKQQVTSLPKYPGARRDIALLVDDTVTHDALAGCIHKAGGKLMHSVTLFDHYRGKNIPIGKKSVAYALVYQDPEQTLTDDAVNHAHNHVIKTLTQQFGATLR